LSDSERLVAFCAAGVVTVVVLLCLDADEPDQGLARTGWFSLVQEVSVGYRLMS
jgi:hypothetical protein